MFKYILFPALVVASLFGTANAQDLNMDLSGLVRWNMQQDQAAMQQAAQFAQDWYNARQAWRRQTGYYGYLPGPVSTADLVRSNAELQAAYGRQHAAWHDTSRRTTDAIDRWDRGAIRGEGTYYDPQSGQQVMLPWTEQSYHPTPYGQYAPGVDPYGYQPTYMPYYGP